MRFTTPRRRRATIAVSAGVPAALVTATVTAMATAAALLVGVSAAPAAGSPPGPLAGFASRTGVAPATGPDAAGQQQISQPDRLTNLDHLDFLYDTVAPPDQEGHTTYRLDTEPAFGVVWVYTQHNPDGSYTRVGGGAYDPDTNTWGQGSYDTDDITRNAVAYLRHWQEFGDAHSREYAYQLLRGAAYFQTVSGPNTGNFEIWMQPDGTIQHHQVPHDGNDEQANWSLARGIWAFGEGYEAFRDVDPQFAAFLADRLSLAFDALDRQVLNLYGQYQLVDGLRWPRWFIPGCYCEPYGDAGATADAVQGLVAFIRASRDSQDQRVRELSTRATRITTQFADGLQQMALGDAYRWPFGAIMPNPGYRAVWHGWGSMMPGALAEAGSLLGRQDWVQTAADSMARFAPHLIVQGGPDNFWAPTPVSRIQTGFAVDNLVQDLYDTGVAADRPGLRELAGVAAAWYFGDNYAHAQMYSPQTGRLYDGLDANGNVNLNSGAETAHAVMSMELLDAHPDLARRGLAASPIARDTWAQAEAEDGDLSGDADLGDPCTFVVAEGWCSGREVVLRPGGSVRLSVDVSPGRYVVMPAFTRQELAPGVLGLDVAVNGQRLATVDVGGAGPQGVTPRPGYYDIATIDKPVGTDSSPTTVDVAYSGESGHEIRLDAVLLQPLVESHTLGDAEASQAVLRSFSHRTERQTVRLPSSGLVARTYDQQARLVSTVRRPGSAVTVPVPAGGFAIVSSWS